MIWALLHCLLWGPLWFLHDLSTTPFISSFLANCFYFNILILYCWILHHLGLTLWLGMLCIVGTKLECSPLKRMPCKCQWLQGSLLQRIQDWRRIFGCLSQPKGCSRPCWSSPCWLQGHKKTRQNNLLDQGYHYHCPVHYYLSFIVQVNLIISCNIEPVRLLYEEIWYEWLGWTVAVVTSPNSILRYSNSSRCSQPNNYMFFSAC